MAFSSQQWAVNLCYSENLFLAHCITSDKAHKRAAEVMSTGNEANAHTHTVHYMDLTCQMKSYSIACLIQV